MDELREWDTMPDVDGWYWLDGNVWVPSYNSMEPPENRIRMKRVLSIVLVECGDIGTSIYLATEQLELCDEDYIDGAWFGPLTPPWEEE